MYFPEFPRNANDIKYQNNQRCDSWWNYCYLMMLKHFKILINHLESVLNWPQLEALPPIVPLSWKTCLRHNPPQTQPVSCLEDGGLTLSAWQYYWSLIMRLRKCPHYIFLPPWCNVATTDTDQSPGAWSERVLISGGSAGVWSLLGTLLL